MEMARSIPSSPSARGGAVRGTSSVETTAATSEISPSSPTIRAKAGDEVAAQPVAMITRAAPSGPSSPASRTMPQASSGQTARSQTSSAPTSRGRRRCAST